ncbi:MAG: ATP-dependent metallopeptidase FtsH/Yme1/Tma family protein [Thermoleophilia bacterium]
MAEYETMHAQSAAKANVSSKGVKRKGVSPIPMQLLAILLTSFLLLIGCSDGKPFRAEHEEISFEEFVRLVDAGEVDSVVVYERDDKLLVSKKANTNESWAKYNREYSLTEKLLEKGVTLRSVGYGRSKGTHDMEDISFNEFVSMVENDAVEGVELNPKYMQAIVTSKSINQNVSVYYLEDFPLVDFLIDHNVDVNVRGSD